MKKNIVVALIILVLLVGIGGYLFLKPKASIPPCNAFHVGVLSGLDFFLPTLDGFKQKMAELGYVEGKNITYDVQKAAPDVATYRKTVNKFITDNVDLIFV